MLARQPNTALRLLLIAADPSSAEAFPDLLGAGPDTNFLIGYSKDVSSALSTVIDNSVDLILLDLSGEEVPDLELLVQARQSLPDHPIICLVNEEDESVRQAALARGAVESIALLGADARTIQQAIRYGVEHHRILCDLEAAKKREHFLATHDGLTGLPNRNAFLSHLERAISYASRGKKHLAVLFLDLDRFKTINDSLGHPAGDELLRTASARMRDVVRDSDMVARVGGDEFMVMLHDVKRAYDPARVAKKVTRALADPFLLGDREYRITASTGIAIFPRDGEDATTLIRNADTAMYHAKSAGPNRYSYYSQEMNEAVAKNLDLEHRLRQAIAEDRLIVHYQPQVDLASGRVVGAEALVRWNDPERGVIPPVEFIPLAEETGMINNIGAWVLRTACEDSRHWEELGRGMRVAVNVSSKQLAEPDFCEIVTRVLRESRVDPANLELEITETSVLEQHGVTLSSLNQIRQNGIRIAIDDFGTGYSALSALKTLPVDTLKVDRSFVSEVLTNRGDATITGGLITMSRGLGLQCLAEGVETEEQMRFLFAHGCHHMQGYLFGKPVPADEFFASLDDLEKQLGGYLL